MLTGEFAHSSGLHAARALVHAELARAESARPDALAHHVRAFGWSPVGTGGLHLSYEIARQELGEAGACTEQTFRYRARFDGDASGGRLEAQVWEPDGEPRDGEFARARPEHRSRAFAHRWLWAWENVGDGSALRELLVAGPLDIHFHSGDPVVTVADFDAAVRRLDGGSATHHRLDALTVNAAATRYSVVADVAWRAASAGGTPLRARTRYAWQLLDDDERFPRLERMRVTLLEPLRAELPEEAPGPDVPNAPSDDAEAGGP